MINTTSTDTCQTFIVQASCVVQLCNTKDTGTCYSNDLIASAATAVVQACGGAGATGGNVNIYSGNFVEIANADAAADTVDPCSPAAAYWYAGFSQGACPSPADVQAFFTGNDVQSCTEVPINFGISTVSFGSSGFVYNGFAESDCPGTPLVSFNAGCSDISDELYFSITSPS